LLEEFGAAFGDAEHALVLPIYQPSGRETHARPVTSEQLVERIRAAGHRDARFVESFDAARNIVEIEARAGDLVLTMGAGDVTRLSDVLVEALT
jgi:UDP-N-acetylmuramate--alanine ligase